MGGAYSSYNIDEIHETITNTTKYESSGTKVINASLESKQKIDEKKVEYINKTIHNTYQKPSEKKSNSKLLLFIKLFTFLLLLIILILYNEFFYIYNEEYTEEPKIEYQDVYKIRKSNYKIKGNKLKTNFIKTINYTNPWPSYPRKNIERSEWMNLNGLWDYSIVPKGKKPTKIDGQILVPFCLESALSGVMKNLTENKELYYYKKIKIPKEWKNKKILLNFGAVDWETNIYINNKKVGEHIGGYSPFSFDITKYLNNKTFDNNIIVKVFDPSDKNYQPVGKQTFNPRTIYYSSVSGIWQTVWMEPVDIYYIKDIKIENNFDNKTIGLIVITNLKEMKLPIEIKIFNKKNLIERKKGLSNEKINIILSSKKFYPWSPDEPNLYFIKIKLFSEDKLKIYDKIETYTAIRKIEKKKDSKGKMRFFLNNKTIYSLGTLDQGYFPDGLYTPPNENAMLFDLYKLKNLGFNTIRKHVKIEPSLYYYYTDKLGFLVWQDMVAGDFRYYFWNRTHFNQGKDKNRTLTSKKNYYQEWENIMKFCMFYQSIIVWVTFNEAWGQFETEKVVKFTKNIDNSRLINSASGGNYRYCGDIVDLHSYPIPIKSPRLFDKNKINVFGEFGGLGLHIKKHSWSEKVWGYRVYENKTALTENYIKLIDELIKLYKDGFSGAIYTQTTDVENEVNGIISYDRKVIKMDERKVRKANLKLVNTTNL